MDQDPGGRAPPRDDAVAHGEAAGGELSRRAWILAAALLAGCGASEAEAEAEAREVDQAEREADRLQALVAESLDPLRIVRAPSLVPLPPGARLGWGLRQLTRDGSGMSADETWALVGQDSRAWFVEHRSDLLSRLGSPTALFALRVDKASGRVLQADCCEPGERVVAAKLSEADVATTTSDDVGPIGALSPRHATAVARRWTLGDETSWVGAGGPLDGVPLLFVRGKDVVELTGPPEAADLTVAGRTLPCLTLRFETLNAPRDGPRFVRLTLTTDPLVRGFTPFPRLPGTPFGLVRGEVEGGPVFRETVAITSDERPKLPW